MSAIRQVTLACAHAFGDVDVSLSDAPQQFRVLINSDALQDERGRFRVWAGNLGAFQKGHSSLDYRLRESPLLQDNVLRFLDELRTTLQEIVAVLRGERLPYDQQARPVDSDDDSSDVSSVASSDASETEDEEFRTELEQRFANIVDLIDNLFSLSIRIRSPTLRSRALKAAAYRPLVDGVDILSQYAELDLQHAWHLILSLRNTAEDKTSNHGDEVLIKRIGSAITKRRQLFRYWRRHHEKLTNATIEPSRIEERKPTGVEEIEQPAIQTQPQPAAFTTDLAERAPPSERNPRSMLSATTATQHHQSLDEAADAQSVTSVATTAKDIGGHAVELPPPPRTDDKDFECPYCRTICPSRYSSSRAWRSHLLQDLAPYICTYESCNEHDQIIRSRREWEAHENAHRRAWKCPQHPDTLFLTESSLRSHLLVGHATETLNDQQLNAIVRISSTASEDTRSCPLCLLDHNSISNLHNHIANHLERLAAFALPRDVDYDDARSGGSNEASLGRTEEASLSWQSASLSSAHLSEDEPAVEKGLVENQQAADLSQDAKDLVAMSSSPSEPLSSSLLQRLPDGTSDKLEYLMLQADTTEVPDIQDTSLSQNERGADIGNFIHLPLQPQAGDKICNIYLGDQESVALFHLGLSPNLIRESFVLAHPGIEIKRHLRDVSKLGIHYRGHIQLNWSLFQSTPDQYKVTTFYLTAEEISHDAVLGFPYLNQVGLATWSYRLLNSRMQRVIHVSNLPAFQGESELAYLFQGFEGFRGCHVPEQSVRDSQYGFVEYEDFRTASQVVQALNGKPYISDSHYEMKMEIISIDHASVLHLVGQAATIAHAPMYDVKNFDLEELAKHLQGPGGVQRVTRRHHLRLYHDCIIGSDLTDWLLQHFQNIDNRQDAVQLGTVLLKDGVLVHIEGQDSFRDGPFYYQINDTYRIRPESTHTANYGLPPNKVKNEPDAESPLLIEVMPSVTQLYKRATIEHVRSDYSANSSLNDKVLLVTHDIAKIQVDAVVNSWSLDKSARRSGYLHAGLRALGGPKYREAVDSLREKDETRVLGTTPGFELPCRYVIHVATPVYPQTTLEGVVQAGLRSCYWDALATAVKTGVRTVAFPSLGTGGYGFPHREAANIALSTIRQFLESEEGQSLDKVVICVFSDIDRHAYVQTIPFYFPTPSEHPGPSRAGTPIPTEIPRSSGHVGRFHDSAFNHNEIAEAFARGNTHILIDSLDRLAKGASDLATSLQIFADVPIVGKAIMRELYATSAVLLSLERLAKAKPPEDLSRNHLIGDIAILSTAFKTLFERFSVLLDDSEFASSFTELWTEFVEVVEIENGMPPINCIVTARLFTRALLEILKSSSGASAEGANREVLRKRLEFFGHGGLPADQGVAIELHPATDATASDELSTTSAAPQSSTLNVLPSEPASHEFESMRIERPSSSETSWDLLPTLAQLYDSGELSPPPTDSESKRGLSALISFIRHDITKIAVDAIVNASDKTFLGGGILHSSIVQAAGPSIRAELVTLRGCEYGKAKATKGYMLPALRVLHTVTPSPLEDEARRDELLRDCYRSCLNLAVELGLRTISLPCLGTGLRGFPRKRCAYIAISEVYRFLVEHPSPYFDRIIFCVYKEQDEVIYRQLLPTYFPPDINDQNFSSLLSRIAQEPQNNEPKVQDIIWNCCRCFARFNIFANCLNCFHISCDTCVEVPDESVGQSQATLDVIPLYDPQLLRRGVPPSLGLGDTESMWRFLDAKQRDQQDAITISERPARLMPEGQKSTKIKIHRSHICLDTLIYYRVPWELDQDDTTYIRLLKDYTTEDTNTLFRHTRQHLSFLSTMKKSFVYDSSSPVTLYLGRSFDETTLETPPPFANHFHPVHKRKDTNMPDLWFESFAVSTRQCALEYHGQEWKVRNADTSSDSTFLSSRTTTSTPTTLCILAPTAVFTGDVLTIGSEPGSAAHPSENAFASFIRRFAYNSGEVNLADGVQPPREVLLLDTNNNFAKVWMPFDMFMKNVAFFLPPVLRLECDARQGDWSFSSTRDAALRRAEKLGFRIPDRNRFRPRPLDDLSTIARATPSVSSSRQAALSLQQLLVENSIPCPDPSCAGREFIRQSDLDQHIRDKHPDTTKYWCSIQNCKRSQGQAEARHFDRRDKRDDHMMRVHGSKPTQLESQVQVPADDVAQDEDDDGEIPKDMTSSWYWKNPRGLRRMYSVEESPPADTSHPYRGTDH